MLQRLLGMITLLISTHCIAAPTLSTPEGFNAICNYGNTCLLSKANLVAFGSQGQYIYKVLSGSFACTEKTFNRSAADATTATCSIRAPQQATTSTNANTKTPSRTINNGLTDGVYAIVSRHSGKALALNGNNLLRQAPYNNQDSNFQLNNPSKNSNASDNQYFELKKTKEGYYTFKALMKNGAAYLTVKNWQTSDGAELLLSDKNNSWNQEWLLKPTSEGYDATTEGYYAIVSRFNNKALDLLDLNTHNNAKLQLWTYWGGNNQQWQLIPAKNIGTLQNHFEF